MTGNQQIVKLNNILGNEFMVSGNFLKATEYYQKNLFLISIFNLDGVNSFEILNNLMHAALKYSNQKEDPIKFLIEFRDSLISQLMGREITFAAIALIDSLILGKKNLDLVDDEQYQIYSNMCENIRSYSETNLDLYKSKNLNDLMDRVTGVLRNYLINLHKYVDELHNNGNLDEAALHAKKNVLLSEKCLANVEEDHEIFVLDLGAVAYKLGNYFLAKKHFSDLLKSKNLETAKFAKKSIDDINVKLVGEKTNISIEAAAMDLMNLVNIKLQNNNYELGIDYLSKSSDLIKSSVVSEELKSRFSGFLQELKPWVELKILSLIQESKLNDALLLSDNFSSFLKDNHDNQSRYFDSFSGQIYFMQNDCVNAVPLLESGLTIYQELGKDREVGIIGNWIETCSDNNF